MCSPEKLIPWSKILRASSESLREGCGRIGVDIHTKVEVPPLNIQLQADPLPCLTLWRMFRGMHPLLFIFMKITLTFWLPEILSRIFKMISMKPSWDLSFSACFRQSQVDKPFSCRRRFQNRFPFDIYIYQPFRASTSVDH